MVRLLMSACAIAFFAAGPVLAQDGVGTQTEAVIRDQIAAFGEGDTARAFDHASEFIQRRFGDPARFGAMVQQGYPMIWGTEALAFGALAERDGRLMQRVIVTGPNGVPHAFDYEMVPDTDGWKINGVYPVAPPEVGA